MAMVTAIFENVVFRPVSLVELPEGTRVTLDAIAAIPSGMADKNDPGADEDLREIYSVLSELHESGHTDTAARHDEQAA